MVQVGEVLVLFEPWVQLLGAFELSSDLHLTCVEVLVNVFELSTKGLHGHAAARG